MGATSQMKKAFWAWIGLIWCSTAYAAQNSFSDGIESIPGKAIGYAVALAFIGGFTATTTKIAKADIIFKNIWLEMLKDIMCSLFAGLCVFLLTSWVGALYCPFYLQAALISLSGYAGSRIIERAVENGLLPWVDRIFPASTNAKPPEAQ